MKNITLFETDNFESWTDDTDDNIIFIHILDRGLDLSFTQQQWFEFMRNITKTNSKIKCTHCYHEIPNQNKKICCICDKKEGFLKND